MTNEATSDTLVQRLKDAEKAIAIAQGPFVLFVLAEREEAPGKWDLLVSAEWLDISRKGIDHMVAALKPFLEPIDWRQLASITPLSPAMNYVQWIAQKYAVQHGVMEVTGAFWDGVYISHAFLITADAAPAPAAQEAVAA